MPKNSWMDSLQGFRPVGAHSDGDTISSATVLVRPTGASKLLIQTVTQNVRMTLDGTTPAAGTGFQLIASDPPIVVFMEDEVTVTVIEESATADLQYQWGN